MADGGVDFDAAVAVIGGVRQTSHFICMDLPQSDRCLVTVCPRETSEAFLDVHGAACRCRCYTDRGGAARAAGGAAGALREARRAGVVDGAGPLPLQRLIDADAPWVTVGRAEALVDEVTARCAGWCPANPPASEIAPLAAPPETAANIPASAQAKRSEPSPDAS